ncbi:hypothetical protein ACFRMQ_03830 [Kitasatospora sp. NPDC056783]|uniref:hypothetical protein n=1 Tax=Kitasatospora sp. NPDC056783 TaxID=3345943 RepID=UPI00369652EF
MDRPDRPDRPRRLLPLLTVALPLVGTPAAVTAVALFGDVAHRAVPSATVLTAAATALLGHLCPNVLQPYGR